MVNTVMKEHIQSSRRYIYSLWLVTVIIWIILYAWSFGADIWLDERIQTKQDELSAVEKNIATIGSEKAFFSYKFAEGLVSQWWTKRSYHITALINVLKEVQSNSDIGSNAIKLSDFTISPTKLSLQGKVNNLLLLYYSTEDNSYTSIIDRFAKLPFISNIEIKKYNKVWDYYEFTLLADINPNALIQQPDDTTNTTNTTTNTTDTTTDQLTGSNSTSWSITTDSTE